MSPSSHPGLWGVDAEAQGDAGGGGLWGRLGQWGAGSTPGLLDCAFHGSDKHMYTRMHTHMLTQTHTHIHAYTMYTQARTHTYTHAHDAHTHAHRTHACTQTHAHTCRHAHTHRHADTGMHLHRGVHLHRLRQAGSCSPSPSSTFQPCNQSPGPGTGHLRVEHELVLQLQPSSCPPWPLGTPRLVPGPLCLPVPRASSLDSCRALAFLSSLASAQGISGPSLRTGRPRCPSLTSGWRSGRP